MKSFQQKGIAVAIAGALTCGLLLHPVSAKTVKQFCSDIGGTFDSNSNVCTFTTSSSGGNQNTIKLAFVLNADETIDMGYGSGEFQFVGGEPYSAAFSLSTEGHHQLEFDDQDLIFKGGTSGNQSFGLGAVAYGSVATGQLNAGRGKVSFIGSDSAACELSAGAWELSVDSPSATLTAQEILIQGGNNSPGIYMMTANSGKSELIENAGQTEIIGGQSENAPGIHTMAAAVDGAIAAAEIQTMRLTIHPSTGLGSGIGTMAAGTGSTGRINASGLVEVDIVGSANAYGIAVGAVDGGSAEIILTDGMGSLHIEEKGILNLVQGSGYGSIENKRLDAIIISAGDQSFAIQSLAFNNQSLPRNTAEGRLVNSTGQLKITGGSKQNSAGIATLAFNTGSGYMYGYLQNQSTENPALIEAGTGAGSAGISAVAQGYGAIGEITNAANAEMTLRGNDVGGFGIGYLATAGGSGTFVNEGRLNLEKNAIYALNDGISTASFKNTGIVNTLAENIFTASQSLEGEALAIEVFDPSGDSWRTDETKLDSYATEYEGTVWVMKDDWKNNSTWTNGTLNFTDIDADSADAASLYQAFVDAKGEDVEITFKNEELQATIDQPQGPIPKFTTQHVAELIASGYAGAVVSNVDLDLSNASGGKTALVVGSRSDATIRDSFGFRKVKGVSSLTVKDGKYFVLAGTKEGGSLIEGDGNVTLENGQLKLGVETDTEATSGTLSSVALKNGGELQANHGSFKVEKVEGQGSVSVKEAASLDVGEASISGDIHNAGTLEASNLKVTNGTLESSGSVHADGTLEIGSTAKLVVDGTVSADKVDVKGVVIRGKNANIVTGAAAQAFEAKKTKSSTKLAATANSAISTLSEDGTEEPRFGLKNPTSYEGSEIPAVDAQNQMPRWAAGTPISPAQAQAFAEFDAVNRIASDIEAGTTPDQHGLWVKLQTNEGRFGVVKGGSSFDVDTDGAIVGAEANVTPAVKLGAALSYLDGEIEAAHMKNNWESWGLHLYGVYQADGFALKGTAGWLRGTTETSKDLDADILHAGLRAEYGVPMGVMTITPFMGARLMSGSFDELDSQTVFSISLGAKVSGEINTAGWTLKPAIEAAYVRSMGDTDAEASDADLRFLPKDALRGSIGLKAEKGMWSSELSYVGATGLNDYRSNSFNVKVELRF